jgi:hypothetical protein
MRGNSSLVYWGQATMGDPLYSSDMEGVYQILLNDLRLLSAEPAAQETYLKESGFWYFSGSEELALNFIEYSYWTLKCNGLIGEPQASVLEPIDRILRQILDSTPDLCIDFLSLQGPEWTRVRTMAKHALQTMHKSLPHE